ncbi:hypothetical protein RB195_001426 [Necator americanus]|uniref:Uncharacterized protein n=1 Tax=Necator americanus TaxID=51031 RepID=A0ABR1DE92_NECAM
MDKKRGSVVASIHMSMVMYLPVLTTNDSHSLSRNPPEGVHLHACHIDKRLSFSTYVSLDFAAFSQKSDLSNSVLRQTEVALACKQMLGS